MNWKKTLTPTDTEEVRPGLFIQEKKNEKGPSSYKVINPICWKGKYRWGKQFSWKNLIWIVLIAFLAWTYQAETEYSRQLQEDPCVLLQNITNYCSSFQLTAGDAYDQQNYPVIIQDYP